MLKKEYILCASVRYNDIIISGYRHADCHELLKKLKIDFVRNKQNEGFLTSNNRFVDRTEAYWIAKENNQIQNYMVEDDDVAQLISEDLY